MAIDVFKSLHNMLPEDLNSYFKYIRITGDAMDLTLSYRKSALRPEKSCLPTKEPAFTIDLKNLFVMKHPYYYLKINYKYRRHCRFPSEVYWILTISFLSYI